MMCEFFFVGSAISALSAVILFLLLREHENKKKK